MSGPPLRQNRDLSPTARRLFSLLPRVYLARNEGLTGRPLLPLLEVLAEPLRELELAIEQLADDHFVERCSPEALEHIAELVGARILGKRRAANRGIVARSLHWRRRKGTAATLEEVLEITTGWWTEVDEAYRSLLHTQDLANPVPWRGRTAVLWDPIALSDPLSRRAPRVERSRRGEVQRASQLARLPGEELEDTLRRLGRADAGRHAASPRTIDFGGWARPEIAVIRTSRFVQRELDRVRIDQMRLIQHRDDPQIELTGLCLDPAGRDRPLIAREEREPAAATGGLTSTHEPERQPRPAGHGYDRAYAYRLLTPTTLAADGDAAEEADNLSLFIDGVRIVGQAPGPEVKGPLAYQAAGAEPVLRFADLARPSPGEDWRIELMAVDNAGALQADTPLPTELGEPAPAAENPILARTSARQGEWQMQVSDLARIPRRGAQVGIRLSRPVVTGGYRRASDGRWESRALALPVGAPLSDLALMGMAGNTQAVRLVRLAGESGTLVLQRHRLDDTSSDWNQTQIDWGGMKPAHLPLHRPRRAGPAFALLADNQSLLLVGPRADGEHMGVWRIDDAMSDSTTAVRFDDEDPAPEARWLASTCLHRDVLYLFGGENDAGRVLGDLWSMPLTGSGARQWRTHRLRNRQTRSGGRLLSSADGLVLLGGATRLGTLDPSLYALDPTRPRPRWEPLPALPIESGAPGVLWARVVDEGLEVLLWANRLWPRHCQLPFDSRHWRLGDLERDGSPNPPAEGEVLHHMDRWWVLGPAPLPPSEVILSLAGDGHLIFLPAVDLLQRDQWELYLGQADGSSDRWAAPGTELTLSLRLGAGRHASAYGRSSEQARLGAPGRLGWAPLRLRQRSLGPWHRPLALQLEDTLALDPRLGRVLLPADIGQGRFQASYRIGRSAALGAGFLPGKGRLDEHWLEPEADLTPASPPESLDRRFWVWVSPDRAQAGLAGETNLVATTGEALARNESPYLLAFKDSPRLPPQRLAIADGESLSMFAAANGSYPVIGRDSDGGSVSLHERLGPVANSDRGPGYWLSGLMLDGTLEVALGTGQVQLRWCDAGAPGETAVRVVGGGHQSALALRSIPHSSVRIWLYGCVLGCIELPPWAQLIAAGCLIDGGNDREPAIRAAGARVRLRHCTVRGQTLAGELGASSCAFQGQVRCDRPDRGWLRYCLLPEGKRLPQRYQSRIHGVSFASVRPTDPDYLMLSPNNGQAALQAGEHRRLPGAHGALSTQLAELVARTDEFLPLSLAPQQIDRTRLDLHRLRRRES